VRSYQAFQFDAPGDNIGPLAMAGDQEARLDEANKRFQGRVFPEAHFAYSDTTVTPRYSSTGPDPGFGDFYDLHPDLKIENVLVPQGRQVAVFISVLNLTASFTNPCAGYGFGWNTGIRMGVQSDVRNTAGSLVGGYALWQPAVPGAGITIGTSTDYSDFGSMRTYSYTGLAHFNPNPGFTLPGTVNEYTFTVTSGFGTANRIRTDVSCPAAANRHQFRDARFWVFVL
jgi:hypothetical protein